MKKVITLIVILFLFLTSQAQYKKVEMNNQSTNLLANPNFETWASGTPTGWTISTTGSTITQSATTPSGTGSALQIAATATVSATQIVIAPNGTFDTNKTYQISFKYKVTAGDGTDNRIWCSWISSAVGASVIVYNPLSLTDSLGLKGPGGNQNPASGIIGDGTNGYLKNNINGNWETYVYTFVAPAGMTQFNFQFRTYNKATVIWDDFYFGEAPVIDTQAPSVPTNLSNLSTSTNSFMMTWSSSSDNVGVYGYDVYKNGEYYGSTTTNSLLITGLTNGTTYSMTVLAKDDAGNKSNQSTPLLVTTAEIVDNESPSTPTGLSNTTPTTNSFTLNWNSSTDNVGVIGYDVYKNGELYGSSITNSLYISGLNSETTYSMTVQGKDAAGNKSNQSIPLLVTTAVLVDTESPSTPAGLYSSNTTINSFVLNWNASTDNVGVIGYDVYKNGEFYGSTSTSNLIITGLSSGNTYSMTVLAKDATGNISIHSSPIIVLIKKVYYVKSNGIGDGSSWSNASGNIQAMIDKAVSGEEVWVAKGTYFPSTETIGRDARSRTFLIKDGVNVYGSFVGDEISINQRVMSDIDNNGKIDSWEFTNSTIISGDIDGVYDVWVKTTNADGVTLSWTVSGNNGNCYRVLTCQSDLIYPTIFDGFYVKGGNSNIVDYEYGGGILAKSNLNVQKCIIRNCYAKIDGGGIKGNIQHSLIDSCSVGNNGGGIYGRSINCRIKNCFSINNGGGVYGYAKNCELLNCSSSNYGGGVYSLQVVDSCFANNCSAYYGGGIYSNDSVNNSTANSCISRFVGGGIYSKYVTYSTVEECSSNNGGGIASHSALKCVINNCTASSNGGGLYSDFSNFYSSPSTIKDCKITNCNASNGAGLYSSAYNYSSSVKNCVVKNCSASEKGGGIYSSYTANYGGTSSSASVSNCLVLNCNADSYGGGIYSSESGSHYYNSYAFVANCTVANCSSSINDCIYNISHTTNSIKTNCIIVNSTGTNSNVATDIQKAFIKPTSFIGKATSIQQQQEILLSDWHLSEGSPYINIGDLTYLSSTFLSNNDLDDKPRLQYDKIDLGAFEYTIPVINLPIIEDFDSWSDFDKSDIIYNSATINGNRNGKWIVENKKAVFNWKANLTNSYNEQFLTYSIDATKSNKVFLEYDMYYEAYSGTIAQLGTEKLNVEISTNLSEWTAVANYSNINGTVQNLTYLHDISSFVSGKVFYVRFRAFGLNTNNIEKWEIDNIKINDTSLCTTPTIQASSFTSPALSENSVTLEWNRGNGNNVLVIAKEGSPVDIEPVDGNYYNASSTFGSGHEIGLGNYVIYNNSGTTVNLTSLTKGSTYYFSIYEYTAATNCYLKPALIGSATTTVSYCDAGSNYNSIYIKKVKSGLMQQESNRGSNGYQNFTSNIISMNVGSQSKVVVTPSDSWNILEYQIYIDWNQNGNLDDFNELYFYTYRWDNVKDSLVAYITPPIDSKTGITRMRIRLRFDDTSNFDPCGFTKYGEVEDYTLNIKSALTIAEQIELNNSVRVYPNPTSEYFLIYGLNNTATLKLTDISGREIFTKIISDEEAISISSLPKGIYIIKLITLDGVIDRTIIKK